MSEDSLAHKIPPSPPDEAEFEAIRAAMSETASGRWFLEEFARRHHPTGFESSFAAIERLRAAMQNEGETLDRMLFDVADMAAAIARTKAEIAGMKRSEDTTEELDSIVRTTESATSRILAAAEQMQAIARTMRDTGIDAAFCDQLDAQATEIFTACTFQDLTGQRTRKVIQVLGYLENRINAMIEIWGKDVSPIPAMEEKSGEESLLSGGEQAAVDLMMHHPAPEPRQDASLEEINRFMLELEPLMAAQQGAGIGEPALDEDTVAAAPADVFEEPPPEPSIAAAVSQEAALVAPEADPQTTDAVPDAPQVETPSAATADAETMLSPLDVDATPAPVAEVEAVTAETSPELPPQEPSPVPAIMALERLHGALNFAWRSPPEEEEAVASLPALEEPAPPERTAFMPPVEFVTTPRKAAEPPPAQEAATEVVAAEEAPETVSGAFTEQPAAIIDELKAETVTAGVTEPIAEWSSSASDSGPLEIPTVRLLEALKPEAAAADAEAIAALFAAPPEAEETTGIVEAAEALEPPAADAAAETQSDDDFLFAPRPMPVSAGISPTEPDPADFLLEPASPVAASAPEPESAAPEAPVAAAVAPVSLLSAFKPRPARALNDPLAPFRTMSDAEKIALFS
jgi:chemotaxis regulatin CheY-phosphate phosphatase CheZ